MLLSVVTPLLSSSLRIASDVIGSIDSARRLRVVAARRWGVCSFSPAGPVDAPAVVFCPMGVVSAPFVVFTFSSVVFPDDDICSGDGDDRFSRIDPSECRELMTGRGGAMLSLALLIGKKGFSSILCLLT